MAKLTLLWSDLSEAQQAALTAQVGEGNEAALIVFRAACANEAKARIAQSRDASLKALGLYAGKVKRGPVGVAYGANELNRKRAGNAPRWTIGG